MMKSALPSTTLPSPAEIRQCMSSGTLNDVKSCLAGSILHDFDLQRNILEGVTFVHLAAELGRVDVLKWLVRDAKCPVEALDNRKGVPLLEAAASGQVGAMEWLRVNGADLEAADERGDTALHIAAGHGQVQTVKWLIQQGCAINPTTKKGITPFLYACAKGRIAEMEELYNAGGDIEGVDAELGWSAAHITAGCNQVEALRWVLARRPDLVEFVSKFGDTPLDVAAKERSKDAYEILQSIRKATRKALRRDQRLSERRLQGRLDAEAKRKAAEEANTIFLREFNEETAASRKLPKPKKSGRRGPPSQRAKSGRREEKRPESHAGSSTSSEEDNDDDCRAEPTIISPKGVKPEEDTSNPRSLSKEGQKDVDSGQWIIKVSKRERRKMKGQISGTQNKNMTKSKGVGVSPNQLSEKIISDERSPGTISSVKPTPVSKLRPTAAPWSPRRKSWNSEKPSASEEELVESGKVVQSEFTRMLKKSIHIDAGARRAAKRRFAKASALYEERRVAVAEKVESAWRLSLCKRLRAGVKDQSLVEIRTTLLEIKSALEERTLHRANSEGEGIEDIKPEVCDFLSKDAELKELVDKSRLLLQQMDPPPLQAHSESIQESVDERSCTPRSTLVRVDNVNNFRQDLEASMRTWSLLGLEKVRLEISLEAAECIPLATQLKFDFESARQGYCVMTTTL